MTKKNLKKLLARLCKANGISGDESEIAEIACEKLRKYCPDARIENGNVIGSLGNQNPNAWHVMLDAHMDRVGLIVTSITEDGFLTVGNVGGLDRRWFPAQRVCVHGTKDIYGIISTLPPHLADGDQKVQKMEQIRIDTGYNATELREIVSPGDSVTFSGFTGELAGGRFSSPALDDRSGMAAILYALDEIWQEDLDCKITVLFSNREEVNGCGAKTGCFAINPDIAVAVDVSFAGDGKLCKTGKSGGGAMIGFSPSLDRGLSQEFVADAINAGLPYQYEVMNGRTGTNADDFAVCRDGAETCTISLPLDYMHTPVETIDINDVRDTGKLLAVFLKGLVNN